MLGKKGRKVLVLERNDRIGGCLRSEEVTEPGFIHDVSGRRRWVLFLTSPAYGAIGRDLEARGLEFAHADLPTGVLRPNGSHVIFSKDRRRNIATFDELSLGDGQTFLREMDALGADAPFLFSLLGGARWSGPTAEDSRQGKAGAAACAKLAAWFGDALTPARGYLETTYRSEDIHALWAPWVLHCGLGPGKRLFG